MSNYDDVTENWRQKFLKEMDQQKIINKFRLCADDNYIYIIYFNHKYRVDRKTGKIQRKEEPDREVGFNTQMVIYNTFYYAVENPCASGELVPFRQVKRVYPFEKAYRETVIQRYFGWFVAAFFLLAAAFIYTEVRYARRKGGVG